MSQRRRYEPNWPDYGGKRKRQMRAVLALVVLIVIGVAASRFAPRGADEDRTPPASTSANATQTASPGPLEAGPLVLVEREGAWVASGPLVRRADATQVRVDHVIDGDTIDVLAAQTPLRVRFYGIDAPERGDRCYTEATRRTAELAASSVVLVPDARQQDRGGRELRYVFTLEGRSLDATLVAEGLALAWREDGVLRERLIAIEERARRERTGCLWAG